MLRFALIPAMAIAMFGQRRLPTTIWDMTIRLCSQAFRSTFTIRCGRIHRW